MIAGLTPKEFKEVGVPVRVHEVREMSGGILEVLLHGGPPDAEYVRGVLNNQRGVTTTQPEPPPGAVGILMRFRAKGTATHRLTKDRAIRVLGDDPYVEVMPNA